MKIIWEDELAEIESTIKALEKVPQKCVTKAAGKGANIVRKAIRSIVPVGKTGYLKRAIVRNGERSRFKGKKVYQIGFDPAYNDVLQKPIKNPGVAGGQRPYAYYPMSVEWGFPVRTKGGGKAFVEGQHFMRRAAESEETASESVMLEVFGEELDKEFMKKHEY